MMEAASGAGARGMTIGEQANRPALLRLALAIVAISFTPILFRLSEIGPTATALYRTGLALPILVAWRMVEQHRGVSSRLGPGDRLALAIGGVVFAVNIAAYAWAVHLTAVANASLLSNLSPIFVSLGGFVVFRDRVSPGFVAAMAAAITGVAILASDKLAIGGDHVIGDAAALLSAVTFAAYLVIVGRLRPRVGAATVMLWTGIFTALSLLAVTLMSGEPMLPHSSRGWTVVLTLAIFSFAIGQGLLTVALARVGATFAAVALLCLPVAAAVYGWILLGEALSATQVIGALIVLASILVARLASQPATRASLEPRPGC
jgi:drug/metabolite transporter (DMT)-like permease